MVVLHNNKTTQESPDAALLLSSLSGHHSSHHHHHGRKGGVALDFVLDDPALEDAAVLRPLKTHNKKQRRVHFASENVYFKRSHALLHDYDFVQQTLWYSLDERASFKQAQKRTAKAVAQTCTTDEACLAVHALFHECLLEEEQQQDCKSSTSTSNASIHHTPEEDRATLIRAFGHAYAGLESVASRTIFRDKHARRQRLYELVDELQDNDDDDEVDADDDELALECAALTRVAVHFAQLMAEMAMEEEQEEEETASVHEEESDDDEQDEFAL